MSVYSSKVTQRYMKRHAITWCMCVCIQQGNTALHEASWNGFSSTVQLLVTSGANVHLLNKVLLIFALLGNLLFSVVVSASLVDS